MRVTAVNDGGRGPPTALDTVVQAMPVSGESTSLLQSRPFLGRASELHACAS